MPTRAPAPRVLVVGSANVDFTVAGERLPRPGETITGGTLLVSRGGKGANQAVAARRLGAGVRLLACVGDDTSGREIRAALAHEGIGVAGVSTTDRAATGTALIVVDAEGRNAIAVAPGANWELTVEMAERRVQDLAWADIVMCQLETPLATVAWVLGEGRRRGRVTLLNPAPMRDEARDLVALADYLTPNETETERLSGVVVRGAESAAAAARALRSRGAGTVIVTLGAQGALACAADGLVRAPALPVAVVDTTAAGESFNAGLAVALGEARALPDALRFASATAALACTRRGAQPSLPRRDQVETLLGA
ncbi:MAG: ribokinase [Candidatus Rokubacteria bacterium 13_1_40CM_69_96]|nr:MAG: ribokinase [Candidatus Rokubacteria bacterium 13_1_40CM_69_96]